MAPARRWNGDDAHLKVAALRNAIALRYCFRHAAHYILWVTSNIDGRFNNDSEPQGCPGLNSFCPGMMRDFLDSGAILMDGWTDPA
jgi:hypothetical protein